MTTAVASPKVETAPELRPELASMVEIMKEAMPFFKIELTDRTKGQHIAAHLKLTADRDIESISVPIESAMAQALRERATQLLAAAAALDGELDELPLTPVRPDEFHFLIDGTEATELVVRNCSTRDEALLLAAEAVALLRYSESQHATEAA